MFRIRSMAMLRALTLNKIPHAFSFCTLRASRALCRPKLMTSRVLLTQSRDFWGWLNSVFNKVDPDRIAAVGPDRACAEWLLRCGSRFKWRGRPDWQWDYNSLAPPGRDAVIEEIDADNACIMDLGFPHFKGMRHVRSVRFHLCMYLDDTALGQLGHLSASLQQVAISSCGNVTIAGVRHLAKLPSLRRLHLFDLPDIRDRDACVEEMKRLLPDCDISFPSNESWTPSVGDSTTSGTASST